MYPPSKPSLERATNSSLGDNGCRYVDPTEHDFKKKGNQISRGEKYSRQTPSTQSKPGELKRDLVVTTKIDLFCPRVKHDSSQGFSDMLALDEEFQEDRARLKMYL